MKKSLLNSSMGLLLCAAAFHICLHVHAQTDVTENEIRTPKAPATPRINGPGIFGVRTGNPFLYHIPATCNRPMTFSVSDLPKGLKLDAASGDISGSVANAGEFTVTLHAKNSKRFRG